MAISPSLDASLRRPSLRWAGWAALSGLAALLWVPVLTQLARAWKSDSSLSHGPVLCLLALGLLWMKRDDLKRWEEAFWPGFALLVASALLHAASYFADIVFLKSLSLIGITLGAIGYLGGPKALRAASGPVGLLLFTIPWPTTLVERLAFPMQLTSSAYAALMGGLMGLSIHREGVELSALSAAGQPIYSMFVAQKCSGLTSLSVLLALAYLIACHTPVRLGWKTLMVAVMVPLALLANTVRLTLVLLAGTHISAAAAQWVHDHEAPVLIFFCSLGIMAFRQALLAWQAPREDAWMQPEGPLKAAASLESSGETGDSLLEAGDGTVDSVSVFIP